MQKQGYLWAVIGDEYIVVNRTSGKTTCAVKSEHQWLIGHWTEIQDSVAIILTEKDERISTNFGSLAQITSLSIGQKFYDLDGKNFTVVSIDKDDWHPLVTVE